MDKVAVFGSFTCKDGEAEAMEEVLAAMVEAAREEPGVEVYSYHRGVGNAFWFFAVMADERSMQQHGQTEAMRSAMQSFMPLMAEPPTMSPTTPVAAIGLAL